MTEKTVSLSLPKLHIDQNRAYETPGRFRAIRCGRRWGKTALGVAVAANEVIDGHYVGWFAPEYKFIAESYRDLASILDPIKRTASKDGVYSTITGGRIDFWSLDNELAGRSRKYHLIIIDEAAFAKNNMMSIWERNLRPTLLDYTGSALVLSNTNGIDTENFMWQICNEPKYGFKQYHAPTHNNPFLPADELVKLKEENHPLVYRQEYLAEFVDWSGDAFFSLDNLLFNNLAVELPVRCDYVFATVDTAAKTGKENDGTAVVYWCLDHHSAKPYKLTVIDYDIRQIEGAMLETWLPVVFQNLENLSKELGARHGSLGVWIEDKMTGIVLLQNAINKHMNAHAIDSRLTALGKSERAIAVSGFVYRNNVKFSDRCRDRLVTYKSVTRNHLEAQVLGFRPGSKDQVDDDLLDCFTYGIAIGLGDSEGF